jgi:hypothetical protein
VVPDRAEISSIAAGELLCYVAVVASRYPRR